MDLDLDPGLPKSLDPDFVNTRYISKTLRTGFSYGKLSRGKQTDPSYSQETKVDARSTVTHLYAKATNLIPAK